MPGTVVYAIAPRLPSLYYRKTLLTWHLYWIQVKQSIFCSLECIKITDDIIMFFGRCPYWLCPCLQISGHLNRWKADFWGFWGSNPGCVTTGRDQETHRVAHNWPGGALLGSSRSSDTLWWAGRLQSLHFDVGIFCPLCNSRFTWERDLGLSIIPW